MPAAKTDKQTARAQARKTKRLGLSVLAFLILSALCWSFNELNLGLPLRNASHDIPFMVKKVQPPEEIVLVYLDEVSHQELGQSYTEAWDRAIHAQLVDRLMDLGAKAIVFDILFHDDYPEKDTLFAESIKNAGCVVVAAEWIVKDDVLSTQQSLLLPNRALRMARVGWGIAHVPDDADGVKRATPHYYETELGIFPSLARKTATTLKRVAEPADEDKQEQSLINYYGPAGTFTGVSYSRALQPGYLPDEATIFKDKIVLMGARQNAALFDAGKDTFPTPSTAITKELMPGVEIHATILGNLLEDSFIQRLGMVSEKLLLYGTCLVLAAAGCFLRPLTGFVICCSMGFLWLAAGIYAHVGLLTLLPWTIPVVVLTPAALGLSAVTHYMLEYAARWRLRSAFKSYMSDEQARQIDEEEVSLELGGHEVEATIMFTDLAGFTSMAEGLPPQAVSKALISYFEVATAGILDNQGTIIKYIGDAVMATWGAPVKTENETDRAIDAAIQMQFAGQTPVKLETNEGTVEQVLETRIGINRGLGLAGNLGSTRRFDYSVIGDTTNLAARLEGMNKMLGTSILVTEAVLAACVDRSVYHYREVGKFIVKGKTQAVQVYEIMGYADADKQFRKRSEEYLDSFKQAQQHFKDRQWDAADSLFNKLHKMHDRLDSDPAAQLYLDAIASYRNNAPNDDWDGAITLTSK